MKLGFDVVCIEEGDSGTLYSVRFYDREENEYERFCTTCAEEPEFEDVETKLDNMLARWGFRKNFFKVEKYPDSIGALYHGKGRIRVYCYLYGKAALVLGVGAIKKKSVRSTYEDPIL